MLAQQRRSSGKVQGNQMKQMVIGLMWGLFVFQVLAWMIAKSDLRFI